MLRLLMLFLMHGQMVSLFARTVMHPTPAPVSRGLPAMLALVLSTLPFSSSAARLACPLCSPQKLGASTTSCSRYATGPSLHHRLAHLLLQGKPFEFQMPFSQYIMENVLFKISYPAEFHAQTAVEAAHILHNKLKALGKSADDIKSIRIRTQEAAMRIINKKGPLHNFADRE